ncbi:hypothetical protein GUJ93_ZPchr0458g22591 [Zizania palustris]|uniref:Uncharacterized protein n=1 Tax=Zizania palustris TaxID=103762 RepID=A0A8J5VDY6_ZIZPA|nr:hypothetical protein GUJ93_ZPchr0458g22591 [Zizania palustris]
MKTWPRVVKSFGAPLLCGDCHCKPTNIPYELLPRARVSLPKVHRFKIFLMTISSRQNGNTFTSSMDS